MVWKGRLRKGICLRNAENPFASRGDRTTASSSMRTGGLIIIITRRKKVEKLMGISKLTRENLAMYLKSRKSI